MRQIQSVYVLVDWHNVQSYLAPNFGSRPRTILPDLLLRIQREVARILAGHGGKYRATLRIYHGWHQGRDATPIRRDFEAFAQEDVLARRLSGVSFTRGFQFGNELICNTEATPLYSTYRGNSQALGQKMVDSAIVSDLFHLLRFNLADFCIIVSDDDDYIPALLTAKSWSARVTLLRQPGRGIQHATDVDCRSELAYWSVT